MDGQIVHGKGMADVEVMQFVDASQLFGGGRCRALGQVDRQIITPCEYTDTADVIDRMIAGIDREENYDLLVELCDTMEGASLCAMGGMTPYPVRSVLEYFAEDFSAAAETDV